MHNLCFASPCPTSAFRVSGKPYISSTEAKPGEPTHHTTYHHVTSEEGAAPHEDIVMIANFVSKVKISERKNRGIKYFRFVLSADSQASISNHIKTVQKKVGVQNILKR
ncbi:uncharacterized protein RAG0_17441 [Rhynchosporium agropyri]|uniref:Uncharacterized protein n=1 Tax=Rhynchosporium agropyri TaxID=914238 RepID=A0A1E1LVH8_9HELO|nr:uncharacterized protein RAG0_17441 [Rhynchosporium agropyri]